ncbi:hypothetical protein A1O3_05107 [Capronia epimyces CBS 606.96]|uniref:2-dehydropantoate 2-reductase n=1 Tax=Capronia epimyces CBS 606.96 TaxID=1182542 RepID=W9YQA6_9EURO|nr:uncharacterized protein A1O3_05107 [Capronia epimyces CBS 606.96]EXJ84439.1 hypothetical protein A1O3_05107 [Capronia epimyces CBS 606.96]
MTNLEHVCLIGAGGVGTIAAYVLENSRRARVTAVLRSNYDLVRDQGFDIDSVDHGKVRGWKPHNVGIPFREPGTDLASHRKVIPSISSAATTALQGQGYDFIVITTKALPDLIASLIPDLKPLVTPGKTGLVLIQNGLDIESPLAAAFPDTPILSGVSMIGSRLTSPCTVFHEDPDLLKLGPYFHHVKEDNDAAVNGNDPNISHPPLLPRQTQLDAARRFVDLYNAGLAAAHLKTGAECFLVDDVVAARWRKLLWNASFNTLCTLLRISVGELLSSPGRTTLLEPAMREIAAIATAAGFRDTVPEHVVQSTLQDTSPTSPFRPSITEYPPPSWVKFTSY